MFEGFRISLGHKQPKSPCIQTFLCNVRNPEQVLYRHLQCVSCEETGLYLVCLLFKREYADHIQFRFLDCLTQF